MRKLLFILAALAAMGLGMLARGWFSDAPAAVPDLTIEFPDAAGQRHRLDEWKGKILVVNFWATWCPPCLEEMPEFVSLQDELGPSGFQFIGIAIDDADSVARFLASKPVNYPILIGEDGGEAWAAQLGNRMNVLPFSAVFDPTGRLVHVQAGRFGRADLLRVIEPMRKAPSPAQ
jgi:thiol-disulfide isomerase/thioredoxin